MRRSFKSVARAFAEAAVKSQRSYSDAQKAFVIDHPHLVWVSPPSKVLPHSLRMTVWDRSTKGCAYCGRALCLKTFTVDHVHSRALGGTDDIENLTIACRSCNARKGARSLG